MVLLPCLLLMYSTDRARGMGLIQFGSGTSMDFLGGLKSVFVVSISPIVAWLEGKQFLSNYLDNN